MGFYHLITAYAAHEGTDGKIAKSFKRSRPLKADGFTSPFGNAPLRFRVQSV